MARKKLIENLTLHEERQKNDHDDDTDCNGDDDDDVTSCRGTLGTRVTVTMTSTLTTGLLLIHYKQAYMKYYFEVANMAASKLEINFRRLLERCEAMAAEFQDNKENVSWRLEKVGGTFDQRVIE